MLSLMCLLCLHYIVPINGLFKKLAIKDFTGFLWTAQLVLVHLPLILGPILRLTGVVLIWHVVHVRRENLVITTWLTLVSTVVLVWLWWMDLCCILRAISLSDVTHVTNVDLSLELWLIIVLTIETRSSRHMESTTTWWHPTADSLTILLTWLKLRRHQHHWVHVVVEDRIALTLVLSYFNLLLFLLLMPLLYIFLMTLIGPTWALRIRSVHWLCIAVVWLTLSLIATWCRRCLSVRINLFGPDQKRIRFVVDNGNLGSWHDELIDELINRVTTILPVIKGLSEVLRDPWYDLVRFNTHRELFQHLIKQGQHLLQGFTISHQKTVLAFISTLIVNGQLFEVTYQRFESGDVLKIIGMCTISMMISSWE